MVTNTFGLSAQKIVTACNEYVNMLFSINMSNFCTGWSQIIPVGGSFKLYYSACIFCCSPHYFLW